MNRDRDRARSSEFPRVHASRSARESVYSSNRHVKTVFRLRCRSCFRSLVGSAHANPAGSPHATFVGIPDSTVCVAPQAAESNFFQAVVPNLP